MLGLCVRAGSLDELQGMVEDMFAAVENHGHSFPSFEHIKAFDDEHLQLIFKVVPIRGESSIVRMSLIGSCR